MTSATEVSAERNDERAEYARVATRRKGRIRYETMHIAVKVGGGKNTGQADTNA